jgi:hypothetical protein
MIRWLFQRLGLAARDDASPVQYDATYGLPREAVADWLKWNPHLGAEHDAREESARSVRDEASGRSP